VSWPSGGMDAPDQRYHLSQKPANIRDFESCEEDVRELTEGKNLFYRGRLFTVNVGTSQLRAEKSHGIHRKSRNSC